MPNPFYQNNFTPFKQAYQMFANSKNPMELFMKLAQKNPNMQQITNMLQMGQNPQLIFNQLCQQRGIDPQQFLKNITTD